MSKYYSSTAASTWFSLQSYTDKFIERDLSDGDKIILHSSILDQIIPRYAGIELPSPLIFEIENSKQSRHSHCGVLEFSSPQLAAFLPQWMMKNLLLQDGDPIRIRVKSLPVATKLILKPLLYEFTLINQPKLSLEFSLRKFTSLTTGDTILIKIAGIEYYLNVIDVTPKSTNPLLKSLYPGVCLVESSPTVEFESPIEGGPNTDELVNIIMTDQLMNGNLMGNQYHYYRFKPIDTNLSLKFFIQSNNTNSTNNNINNNNNNNNSTTNSSSSNFLPDIYISTRHEKPTILNSQWKSSKSGEIIIHSNDPNYTKSWYYISIHSYKYNTPNYTFMITEIPYNSNQQNNHQNYNNIHSSPLKNTTMNSNSLYNQSVINNSNNNNDSNNNNNNIKNNNNQFTTIITPIIDPTYKQCTNCREYISPQSYSMHSTRCARLNYYCELCEKSIKLIEKSIHIHCSQCNLSMNRDELDKHMDLIHGNSKCNQCQLEFPINQLDSHKSNECQYRFIPCQYCELELPIIHMNEHKSECGSKSIQCDLCIQLIPRKRMNIHLACDHQINLSLHPGSKSNYGIPLNELNQLNELNSREIKNLPYGFQQTTKDVNNQQNNTKLSPDELLARTLQASESSVNSHGRINGIESNESDDMELQRVLLESKMESDWKTAADKNSAAESSNPSAASAASAASSASPPPAHSSRWVSGDDEIPDNDADEENEPSEWGSDSPDFEAASPTHSIPTAGSSYSPAVAGATGVVRSDPHPCPYCSVELDGYDNLIDHMNICAAIEED